MKLNRNYDPECEELARYFYPDASLKFIVDLANDFQCLVESRCTHESVNDQGRCTECGEVA